MNAQDPLGLRSALNEMFATREARDAELTGGFISATQYDEAALQSASDARGTIELMSPTGNRYGLRVRADMEDGVVTTELVTINGVEPTQDQWRKMMSRGGHTGYKHTLSRDPSGTIAVVPGYRGAC